MGSSQSYIRLSATKQAVEGLRAVILRAGKPIYPIDELRLPYFLGEPLTTPACCCTDAPKCSRLRSLHREPRGARIVTSCHSAHGTRLHQTGSGSVALRGYHCRNPSKHALIVLDINEPVLEDSVGIVDERCCRGK